MAEAVAHEVVEHESAHRRRFRLAYAGLALVFWLSVAGFVVLLARPHHSHPVMWSKWKPAETSDALLGARLIGHHVAAEYRTPQGGQLVAVQEHLPEVSGLPVEAIGLRGSSPSGIVDPYIALYRTNGTLIYAFCGLVQQNCAVAPAASAIPQRVLRREALELALYAFKYLKGVNQVVSLIRPTKDSAMNAVFMRKSILGAELSHPLAETLSLAKPPVTDVTTRESDVIDGLTLQSTFTAHYEPLPDGDAILVLDPASG